jgi:heat shock protein HtpX
MDKDSQNGPSTGPWAQTGNNLRAPEAETRVASKSRTIQFDVKSFDFRAAMARNIRNTVLLCFLMTAMGCLVGYLCGWSAEVILRQNAAQHRVYHSTGELLLATAHSTWGMDFMLAFLVFSVIGILCALLWADSAMLALNGAREADPREFKQLHNIVEEVAMAAGAPKPKVYVMDVDEMNAFATGLRPNKASVTVTRGLMETLNREELTGVVAHEMGHIINGDVRYAVMVSVVVGLVALIASLMRDLAEGAFRSGVGLSSSDDDDSGGAAGLVAVVVALVVWLLVGLLAPFGVLMVRMAISREREFLADATGAKLTRNPGGLASALAKIAGNPNVSSATSATEHLYIISPMRAVGDNDLALFSTHPPTQRRIDRLLNMK